MARIALPTPAPLTRAPVRAPAKTGSRLDLLANWVGAAFIFGTAAFSLYLTQVSTVATSGYELERLQAERAGWIARNEQLELELAKRRSLAWTETQATQRLGMLRGPRPAYVVAEALPTSSSTTRPTLTDHDTAWRSQPEGPFPPDRDPIAQWIDRASEWVTTAGRAAGISVR